MGTRRMFSSNIVTSARFLRMPIDTQYLYFQLGMKADDDGIVEAFPVMRMIGLSSEDSLKILQAKNFIRVLNEDLVTYITDWTEHNLIRPDRKVDSIYKNLLIEILPDVKLIESRQRSDRQKECGRQLDVIGTSHGRQLDRISKDKISKDNTKKIYGEKVRLKEEEYAKLVETFGEKETKYMIENLDLYIQSKGDKYKSHYATMLSWERKNNKQSIQQNTTDRYRRGE